MKKVKCPCHLVEMNFYINAMESWDFWFETIYFTLPKIKNNFPWKDQQKQFVLK